MQQHSLAAKKRNRDSLYLTFNESSWSKYNKMRKVQMILLVLLETGLLLSSCWLSCWVPYPPPWSPSAPSLPSSPCPWQAWSGTSASALRARMLAIEAEVMVVSLPTVKAELPGVYFHCKLEILKMTVYNIFVSFDISPIPDNVNGP